MTRASNIRLADVVTQVQQLLDETTSRKAGSADNILRYVRSVQRNVRSDAVKCVQCVVAAYPFAELWSNMLCGSWLPIFLLDCGLCALILYY